MNNGEKLSEHILKKLKILTLDLVDEASVKTTKGGELTLTDAEYKVYYKKVKKLYEAKRVSELVRLYKLCPKPTYNELEYLCYQNGELITYRKFCELRYHKNLEVRKTLMFVKNPEFDPTRGKKFRDIFRTEVDKTVSPLVVIAQMLKTAQAKAGIVGSQTHVSTTETAKKKTFGRFNHEERVYTDKELDEMERNNGGGMVIKKGIEL